MIRYPQLVGFFSALLFCAPSYVLATPSQWILIPNESHLTFTATQNDAPVSGEFKHFTLNFSADFNDLAHAQLDVVIDINSLSTSYSQLRSTLMTPEWFNVDKFPKAHYTASEFSKVQGNNYLAKGLLTIRDKTNPVTLKFTADFSDPKKGIFVGSTMIKRRDFGVGQGEWTAVDSIKDEVTINFTVVSSKS